MLNSVSKKKQSIVSGVDFNYGKSELAAESIPTLDLDFTSGSLDPRITFSRNDALGAATYIGADGLLKTATTNHALNTEVINTASWSKAAATVTVVGSINSSTNIFKITEDSTTAQHATFANTATGTIGATCTLSFNASLVPGGYPTLSAFMLDGGFSNGVTCIFNLSTGSAGAAGTQGTGATAISSSIAPLGGGRYRCTLTGIPSATLGTRLIAFYCNGGNSYLGNGRDNVLIDSVQLEQSSVAHDYVPNNTSLACGQPRFDYDPVTLAPKGLLIEEARTNYWLNSRDATLLTGGALITKTRNQVGYDGTPNTGTLIQETNGSGNHYVQMQAGPAAANQPVTISFYIKPAGRVYGEARLNTGAGGTMGYFDTITRTASQFSTYGTGYTTGQTISITDAGNGWFRIVYTATTSDTGTVSGSLFLRDNTGVDSYVGDGVSGMIIDCAQMEVNAAFATSFIPTGATTVSRGYDWALITGTNLSSWYNGTTGTFAATFQGGRNSTPGQDGFSRVIGYGAADSAIIGVNGTAGSYVSSWNGVATLNSTVDTSGNSCILKPTSACVAYSAAGRSLGYNGLTVTTDATVLSATSTVYLGVAPNTANNLNGYLKRVSYWPNRLSDQNIKLLSQT